LVAGTSTVGVDDEGVSRVGNGGNGKPDPRGIGIPPGWLVSGVENGGNGKPDPGGIGIPPGWLVPGAAWPIIVLKTCCIAYLLTLLATQENRADIPTPTPIHRSGDPMYVGDGCAGKGVAPTAAVCVPVFEAASSCTSD
jgi:hypothetical protein